MHCIKDKKKICPAKKSIRISGNGVVSQDSEALLKCCKVQAQIEEAKKLGLTRSQIQIDI